MATLSKNFKNDIVSNANKVDPIVVIADIEVADITHKQTFIPLESFSSIQTSVGYGEEGKTLKPRNIIKDCMWSTLSKGKGGSAFKKCVTKKIKQNVKDISNPEAFASEIWSSVKKKCS